MEDVRAAIALGRREWEEAMAAELLRAVDVWVEDAKQLTAVRPVDARPKAETDAGGGG